MTRGAVLMKIKTVLAFFIVSIAAFAAPTKFTVSFSSPDIDAPGVDFVVEVKSPGGNWAPAATGTRSPIEIIANPPIGKFTVRVIARSGKDLSAPSDEAFAVVGLATPGGVRITGIAIPDGSAPVPGSVAPGSAKARK
jgi:hypothetical protein